MKSSKAELATTFARRAQKADKSSSFFFLMMRFLNPMRIALILFLFGLTGFVVLRAAPWSGGLSLLPAAVVGLVAGNFFLAILGRLMSRMETSDSYRKEDAVGAVGQLTVPIAENGTGEIVFVFAGSKSAAPARAYTAGTQIGKMSKVIITDIRDGVYYVEPWDEVNGEVLKIPHNESA
ncbi:MAG: YqiJ family protein [Candidatus Obscuribacterales bacterium]|nr:YqiJ family protein [Candidatus Obscuribacterales bacterium]